MSTRAGINKGLCWAGDSVSRAATEAEALVAALEAAP